MSVAKKQLRTLLLQQYMKYTILPLVLVGVVLMVLYFSINAYITNVMVKDLRATSQKYNQQVLIKEVEEVEQIFQEVERLALLLQAEHEKIFAQSEQIHIPNPPQFEYAKNGVFFKSTPSGSSLYYSSKTKVGEQERAKAIFTEAMDTSFKTIVDHHPYVAAVYFNSYDDMNRLYPFIENVDQQYGPHIHMEDYNFYYLADAKHNPEKKPVWTRAYLDPAGNGWMISCVVPIYNKGKLEGVTGLDITIKNLVDKYLNAKLPNDSKMFMVDEQGTIMAMPPLVESILGLTELKEHVYSEAITQTVTKPEEFNLLSSKSTHADYFESLFTAKPIEPFLEVEGERYLVTHEKISKKGWHVMILTNESTVDKSIASIHQLSQYIGYLTAAFLLMGFVALVVVIFIRMKNTAQSVTRPLEELAVQTSQIGTSLSNLNEIHSDVIEIERLSSNFNQMVHDLNARTESLIEAKLQKQAQEDKARQYRHDRDTMASENKKLERLSVIDRLTGIYNRHKLDDVLQTEVNRSDRYGSTLGLILIDVDHFKLVNDQYGHQSGDQVLVQIGQLLQDSTRQTDITGRWGGEEFMIICPETDIEGLSQLAEHLREKIKSFDFEEVGNQTASFGVAEYFSGSNVKELVFNADQALYRAKSIGRNRVCISDCIEDELQSKPLA